MPTKDPRVDAFLRHVPQWREELYKLREFLLDTELIESYKWGQRGYLMHVASAKQSATRISRIQKCVGKIFDGKGLLD